MTLKARLARLEHKTTEDPGQLPDGNPFDGSMTKSEISDFLERFI